MWRILVMVVGLLWGRVGCLGEEELLEKVKLGLSNVKEDTVAGAVIVEEGEVPDWLSGSFIRHSCGAFGETGSELEIINEVDHLFDCIEMGQSFQFRDGVATFYNRYYDTNSAQIWRNYQMNMNNSRVYWRTIFAEFDVEQRNALRNNYSSPGKLPAVEHVTWWQVGDKVGAWSESLMGVQVDVHNVEAIWWFPFRDQNLGYPQGTSFIDNPAHGHHEADGRFWASVMAILPGSEGRFRIPRWSVYDIVDDFRTVIGEVELPTIDLALCTGDPYPDLSARLGYMHSISMTENYIVLPATSYLFDPCTYFMQGSNPDLGFYTANYEWYGNHPSYFYVLRKSDGEHVATIETEPFFVTHQLNSYESNGQLHLDMVTYADADIYTHDLFTPQLLHNSGYAASVQRFIIDSETWSLVSRLDLRPPNEVVEFPNINYEYYNTKPYTYAYMGRGIYTTQGHIIKLNVQTGEELEYDLPAGLLPQEPVFVARPDAEAEDDGVVLAQGVDGNKEKGFLVILDARDLSLIAHVTAPDLMLFGIHNNFFSFDVGNRESRTLNGASEVKSSGVLLMMVVAMLNRFILM